MTDEISSSGGLLEALGVDPSIRGAAAALHSGSWFRLREDELFLQTTCGGRQGCRFGSILFNLAYSVALSRIRAALAELGVTLHISPKKAVAPPVNDDGGYLISAPCEVPGADPFWMSSGAVLSTRPAPDAVAAPEATFVDDHVAMLATSSAAELMRLAPRSMSAVWYPLTLKSVLAIRPPVQFRGGMLVELLHNSQLRGANRTQHLALLRM